MSLSANTPILAYEVWSPAPANGVLDITKVADLKWLAISKHRSQTETTDYVTAASALNRYRAVTSGLNSDFAEAYRKSAVSRYAAIAEKLKV